MNEENTNSFQLTTQEMHTVFQSLGDGIAVTDSFGNVTEVNNAFLDICNYESKDEVIGQNALSFVAPKDRERAQTDIIDTLTSGKPATHEYLFLNKDGNEFEAELSTSALEDSIGNPKGTIAVLRDVTQRNRMQEELRKTAEKLRIVFDTLGNIFIVTDMKLKIVNANEATGRVLGFTNEDELIGKVILDLVKDEDRSRIENIIRITLASIEGSGTQGLECQLESNGYTVDVEATIDLLRDCTGMKTGLIFNAKDVTERKQMEEEIRSTAEKLETIIRSIGDGIAVTDAFGNVIDVNDAFLRICQFESKVEVIGRNALEFVDEKDRERAQVDIVDTLTTGNPATHEYGFLTRDGEVFKAELGTASLKDADGNPMGTIAVVRDVTERNQMQEEIRLNAEKLETIIQSIGDGIAVTDDLGNVVEINDAFLRICKFDNKDEVVGKNALEYVAEHDRERAQIDIIETLTSGSPATHEYGFLTRDGQVFGAELGTAALQDSAGNPTGTIAVIRDVTERKRMEDQVRASAEKMQAIFESMSDGVAVVDMTGTIVEANTALATMHKFGSKDQLIGKNNLELIGEQDRDRVLLDMGHTFETRVPAMHEYLMIRSDGITYDAELSAAVLCDREENPVGAIAVIRDITERKLTQKQILEANAQLEIYASDLQRSNQELDDFAYIASHDLKEPLRGIRNYSTFLIEDYEHKLDEDGQKKLHTLIRLTGRLEELIDGLLYFSRAGRAELAQQEADSGQIVRDILETLESSLQETGTSVSIAEDMPAIVCDRTKVGEVFRNLITNAMKYNDKEDKHINIGWQQGDGGYPVFFVRDNGIGIKEKDIDKVFRMFTRLHGRDKYGGGTGAGLTLARKIIQRHGGDMWVESEYGIGTIFHFNLNRREEDNRQGREVIQINPSA